VRPLQTLKFVIVVLLFSLCGCSVDHGNACDDLLARAEVAVKQKDYDVAGRYLDQAAREAELSDVETQIPRVRRQKIELLLAQNKGPEAEKAAQSLVEFYVTKPLKGVNYSKQLLILQDKTRARKLLAEALMKQNRAPEAAVVLKAAMADSWNGGRSMLGDAELADQYRAIMKSLGKQDPEVPDLEDQVEKTYKVERQCSTAYNFIMNGKCDAALALLKPVETVAKESKSEEAICNYICHKAFAEFVKRDYKAAYRDAAEAAKIIRSSQKVPPHIAAICFSVLAVSSPDRKDSDNSMKEALSRDAPHAVKMLQALLYKDPLTRTATGLPIFLLEWKFNSLIDQRERMILLVQPILNSNVLAESEQPNVVKWYLLQAKSPHLKATEKAQCLERAAQYGGDHQPLAAQWRRQAVQLRLMDTNIEAESKSSYLSWLADDYMWLGEYDLALKNAQAGLDACTPVEGSMRARLFAITGKIYAGTKEYDKAIIYLDKAIAEYSKKSYPPGFLSDVLAAKAFVQRKMHKN